MSFRLTVQLPGDRSLQGYSECSLASEAFALYRHLSGKRATVAEILDLRAGERRPITSAELEAIAQRERHERHRSACKVSVRFDDEWK